MRNQHTSDNPHAPDVTTQIIRSSKMPAPIFNEPLSPPRQHGIVGLVSAGSSERCSYGFALWLGGWGAFSFPIFCLDGQALACAFDRAVQLSLEHRSWWQLGQIIRDMDG